MLAYALAGFAVIMLASCLRIFLFSLVPIAAATGWLRPATIDGHLRMLDLVLGFDGFALRLWLVRIGGYQGVPPIYGSLIFAMAKAWALERSRILLRSALSGALLAIPLYLFVPAGPEYAFSNLPETSGALVPASWIQPRN